MQLGPGKVRNDQESLPGFTTSPVTALAPAVPQAGSAPCMWMHAFTLGSLGWTLLFLFALGGALATGRHRGPKELGELVRSMLTHSQTPATLGVAPH